MLNDNLSGHGELAITSYVGIHVDYDCAFLERGHGLFWDRDRSGPTEDSSSRDDHVSILCYFANSVVDFLYELGRQRLCVS